MVTLSAGAIDAGSAEQVFRCSRNLATSSVDSLAAENAAASKSSPRRAGRPRLTWYLTLRSGAGDRQDGCDAAAGCRGACFASAIAGAAAAEAGIAAACCAGGGATGFDAAGCSLVERSGISKDGVGVGGASGVASLTSADVTISTAMASTGTV